ncbi:acyltransferase [Chroococcidiopsis sp.]|uniref:acyltransferase n=1 Tax=Chroococcidiopsis sp. TaxID=3088168 RepID=UPI003F2B18D2
MQTQQDSKLRYEICFPGLPLAVYREVAAHLRQVEGVETGLYPATNQQFDYDRSQVGGLWIQYAPTASSASRELVDRILAYYQQLFQQGAESREQGAVKNG